MLRTGRRSSSFGIAILVCLCMLIFRPLFPAGLLRQTQKSALSSSPSSASIFVKAMSTTTRILCYGDSLTAGTSGYELYPYAPHLEAGLKARGRDVVVRHRGLPGWTVSNMLANLDGDTAGLRSAIAAVKDPPLSIVILLGGTNDLGYGFSAEEIFENLHALHKVAWDSGVPKTVAIGVPPSGFQSVNEQARALAADVNKSLREMCEEEPSKATFLPFPFDFERGGDLWDEDTLHFSPLGYQRLGESLVPVVDRILDEL